MSKKLPSLAVSVVALSACNTGRVGLVDKIQDKDIVDYCQSAIKCSPALLQDVYLFYCVDQVQDQRHYAQRLGCETEFNEFLSCAITKNDPPQCRSEYDDYDDWVDEMEDLYYSDADDPCEDEEEDLQECINDFMGIDDSNTSEPYNGSGPYYG